MSEDVGDDPATGPSGAGPATPAASAGRRPNRAVLAVTVLLAVVLATTVILVVRRNSGASGRTTGSPGTTGSSTTSASPAVAGPPVVPSSGVYLGAWAKPTILTQDGRIQAAARIATDVGEPLAITHTYRTFPEAFGTPSDLALSAGHYLMISWAADDTQRITSGADDQIIAEHARQVTALGRPVFIRFRWEMDRADLASIIHSPADFTAAWRHVRAIFDEQHVRNASWVWCPTAYGFDSKRAEQYYPGDASVDWICADGYAFGGPTPTPRPFATIMKSFLDWADGHDKPIMIGEFGVARSFGAQRGPWIAAVAETVRSHPAIKALVYFDDGPGGVWGVEGDTGAIAGLRKLAQNASATSVPR